MQMSWRKKDFEVLQIDFFRQERLDRGCVEKTRCIFKQSSSNKDVKGGGHKDGCLGFL